MAAEDVPISDAMRTFVASRGQAEMARLLPTLAHLWKRTDSAHGKGAMLSLLWDGMLSLFPETKDPRYECLCAVTGHPISLAATSLARLSLSTDDAPTNLAGANFVNSSLHVIDLSGANLTEADFTNSVLEAVRFCGANLTGARFLKALLVDIDVSGATLDGADFQGVAADSISVLIESAKPLSPRVLLS